jgi:protein-disulfide isomerase
VKGARAPQSRTGFYVALVAILVAGAGVLWYITHQTPQASAITIDPKDAIGVKAEGYTLGSPDAPVEIIEFADFECPGCGQFATVTEPDVRTRLVNTGQARLRIFDLQINSSHRNSPGASMAAACAADQNKFWEMHDKLFAGQNEWSTFVTSNPRPVFERYARDLGLDMTAWSQCYDSAKYKGRIAAHYEEAMRRKIGGTPTFIIGEKMLNPAPQPYDVIKAYVDSARAAAGAAAPAAPAPPADTTKR